jgi:Flp pilus assembly protein TadD
MRLLLLLGMFALAPGYPQQPSSSLANLLELHRSEPSNPNICQQIGIAYIQSQELDKAEPFFREAVRLNPQFWAARKNLATVLWFLDRKAESEREFQTVAKGLPADPVPHLYLGLAAHGRRDFAAAKMQFEKAGELASENPEVLPAVLESYLATSDLEKARMVLEKLTALHKDSPEGWRMLAEAYDRLDKPEDAYRAYSQAIEEDANSEDGYIGLAEFASAHGNNDYALQVVGRGLERLPQSSALIFEQGLLRALNGDRQQAEASFQEAAGLKPDWALPLMALGVSKLESGDAVQAITAFQRARAIDPGDYRVHFLYATALSRDGHNSAENRAEAIRALREAIRLNSKDAGSYVLLGQLESERAEANWKTALKIEPENATALYQLGLLYQKQGKAAEAKALLDKFRLIKAKMHGAEESLVQILRVPHRPTAASDSSTRPR